MLPQAPFLQCPSAPGRSQGAEEPAGLAQKDSLQGTEQRRERCREQGAGGWGGVWGVSLLQWRCSPYKHRVFLEIVIRYEVLFFFFKLSTQPFIFLQIWSFLYFNYIKMRSQFCNLKTFTYSPPHSLPHPQHMTVLRPGMESEPQLWQCWILNRLHHSGNSHNVCLLKLYWSSRLGTAETNPNRNHAVADSIPGLTQ